jgi:hypothetical protein
MGSLTIEELELEDVEVLPDRLVMSACQPSCRPKSCCGPTLAIYLRVELCAGIRL